jgi:transcriptional regulator GlxA family with amidase domain
MSNSANRRNVVVVLYDGVQLLDVAGPAEVFALANEVGKASGYRVMFVGKERSMGTSAGLMLAAPPLASAPRTIHTLVVPGATKDPLLRALGDRAFMRWLENAANRATRVASICSGAFLLGSLGLLDGRRTTTHWSAIDRLTKYLPRASVEREALFVEDGRIWSSAGVATGIDLALALVSRDLGPNIALEVARLLVLHLVRPGGQSQFSTPLSMQRQAGGLAGLVPWLEVRLHKPVTVEGMAAAMGMSLRTFHRQCIGVFAMAPGRLAMELRFDRARALLGDPALPIRDVAKQCGFSDPAAFSKAFGKRFGTSPAAYRRAFDLGSARSWSLQTRPGGLSSSVLT